MGGGVGVRRKARLRNPKRPPDSKETQMPALRRKQLPQGRSSVGYYLRPSRGQGIHETYIGETPRLAWIFDVESREGDIDDSMRDRNRGLSSAVTSDAAHTGVLKSRGQLQLGQSMDKLVGEGIVDTDELIGKKCVVNVSSFEGRRRADEELYEQNPAGQKGQRRGGATARPAPKTTVENRQSSRTYRSRHPNLKARSVQDASSECSPHRVRPLRLYSREEVSEFPVSRRFFVSSKTQAWMNMMIARQGKADLDAKRERGHS